MADDHYQPEDIAGYVEEDCISCKVRVIENLSTEEKIAYRLEVLKELRVRDKLYSGVFKAGQVFECEKPRCSGDVIYAGWTLEKLLKR